MHLEQRGKILAYGKEEARDYLETHHYPMDDVVRRVRFNGKRFLGLIAKYSGKIG